MEIEAKRKKSKKAEFKPGTMGDKTAKNLGNMAGIFEAVGAETYDAIVSEFGKVLNNYMMSAKEKLAQSVKEEYGNVGLTLAEENITEWFTDLTGNIFTHGIGPIHESLTQTNLEGVMAKRKFNRAKRLLAIGYKTLRRGEPEIARDIALCALASPDAGQFMKELSLTDPVEEDVTGMEDETEQTADEMLQEAVEELEERAVEDDEEDGGAEGMDEMMGMDDMLGMDDMMLGTDDEDEDDEGAAEGEDDLGDAEGMEDEEAAYPATSSLKAKRAARQAARRIRAKFGKRRAQLKAKRRVKATAPRLAKPTSLSKKRQLLALGNKICSVEGGKHRDIGKKVIAAAKLMR